jgi:hypothetical protein
VTWDLSWTNASYTPVCSIYQKTPTTHALRVHHFSDIQAGSMKVVVINDDIGSAHTGVLLCQGSNTTP